MNYLAMMWGLIISAFLLAYLVGTMAIAVVSGNQVRTDWPMRWMNNQSVYMQKEQST